MIYSEKVMDHFMNPRNVGAIDDADVQAYVQEIANNFKRTPIIDPMTGQVDLRKNLLPVRKDTPIPLLDGRTITIEELAKELNIEKEEKVELPKEIIQIVEERKLARENKDWIKSDELRDKLISLGYTVKDSKDGMEVNKN